MIMEFLSSLSWWHYAIGTGLLVIAGIALIVVKGYNSVKCKPIPGIPYPPFSNSVAGHPEHMLHPFKHEIRLQVSDGMNCPAYQLLLMKNNSVFINDPKEACRLLRTVNTKGSMYAAMRLDPQVPDILTSDGQFAESRKKILDPIFEILTVSPTLFDGLMTFLGTRDGQNVDMFKMYSKFALEISCSILFNYHPYRGFLDEETSPESQEEAELVASIEIMYHASMSPSIFDTPHVLPLTEEKVEKAVGKWKSFLFKVFAHLKTQYEENASDMEVKCPLGWKMMDGLNNKLYYANEAEVIGELHQLLFHSQECIASMCMWITHSLCKYPRVRRTLEKVIHEHQQTNSQPYPEYLDCVIKEAFRRYPALGNLTVRTTTDDEYQIDESIIPPGIPLHAHMYTIQNAKHTWHKAETFIPERWLSTHAYPSESTDATSTMISHPVCYPFVKNTGTVNVFDGVGFHADELHYFPFSAGPRICTGRVIAIQVLEQFTYRFVSSFRLNPMQISLEEELGMSANATIFPFNPATLVLQVEKIVLEQIVKQHEREEAENDGWANEEEESK